MTENRRPAKLGHKKTRTGCLKCRARRVKCDERHPSCANCSRLGLQCEYRKVIANASQHSQDGSADQHKSPELQTSRDLHRTEMRLLHAYMSRSLIATTARIRSTEAERSDLAEWIRIWFVDLPRLAFEHDNLLYALLAFSATQVLPFEPDIALVRCELMDMALRYQRTAIAKTDFNIEAAVLAGYMICMTAFGMLNNRNTTPYTPPMEWFELAQGANNVCPQIEEFSDPGVLSTILKLTSPIWQSLAVVDDRYAQILYYDEDKELLSVHSEENAHAYRKALEVVSTLKKSVEEEPSYYHHRWICLFPQLVPARFVILLREQAPRALAVMICFWSVLARTERHILLSFGDADGSLPKREIDAIMNVLPQSWHEVVQSQLI